MPVMLYAAGQGGPGDRLGSDGFDACLLVSGIENTVDHRHCGAGKRAARG